MSVVYEVRFTLADGLNENISLSSEVKMNNAEQNKNTADKALKQQLKEQNDLNKKIAGGLTTGVTVATKGYQVYLQVRNIINTQNMVNMGIRGDILAAKNMQIQTARNDAIVSRISTVLNPAIMGAIGGFAGGGGIGGAVVGGIGGLGVGVYNLAKDLIIENINLQSQERAYFADQQLKSYINNIERQRLVTNVGYYR
jgi:hypothetical protein